MTAKRLHPPAGVFATPLPRGEMQLGSALLRHLSPHLLGRQRVSVWDALSRINPLEHCTRLHPQLWFSLGNLGEGPQRNSLPSEMELISL